MGGEVQMGTITHRGGKNKEALSHLCSETPNKPPNRSPLPLIFIVLLLAHSSDCDVMAHPWQQGAPRSTKSTGNQL